MENPKHTHSAHRPVDWTKAIREGVFLFATMLGALGGVTVVTTTLFGETNGDWSLGWLVGVSAMFALARAAIDARYEQRRLVPAKTRSEAEIRWQRPVDYAWALMATLGIIALAAQELDNATVAVPAAWCWLVAVSFAIFLAQQRLRHPPKRTK